MNIAQKILRFMHPKSESERVKMRGVLSRAQAEAEDLTRTLNMNAVEFREMLEREARKDGLQEVRRQVQFDTFAAICEFRYSPPDSLMRLCKNPEHEAHRSGIAACQCDLCPKMKEAMK